MCIVIWYIERGVVTIEWLDYIIIRVLDRINRIRDRKSNSLIIRLILHISGLIMNRLIINNQLVRYIG